MSLHLSSASLLPLQHSSIRVQSAARAPLPPTRIRGSVACNVQTPSQSNKLSVDGALVGLSAEEAEAERLRLEGTDAFAELVKISSRSGGGNAPSTSAALTGGLKKPPWLRQRAPQGDR